MQNCPLCFSKHRVDYHQDKQRSYLQCQDCQLVFVPAVEHLNLSAEKAIYDLHQNDLLDKGYYTFLSRLSTPLLAYLKPHSIGLDYGCGPAPLLAKLLEESGHRMAVYDPFYAPDVSVLEQRYDFISCTEVAEHFREPHQEFQRLFGLLNPGGILAIMTKRVLDPTAFSSWHYKNDLTHICFFSEATFHWLAHQYGATVNFPSEDVAIFKT